MSLEKPIYDSLKKNNLSDTSIKTYIRNLRLLNDGNELNNLKFLKDKENIMEKLKNYTDNTKRNYLISIVSILRQFKDKEKLYNEYYKLMLKQHDLIKNKPQNEMTETQKKNWIEWKDLEEIYNKLGDEVSKFKGKQDLENKEYGQLLKYVTLSLYMTIPPRRSKDYYMMNVVYEYDKNLSNDYNYLDWKNKKFYFNNYKTAKTYNQQVINIPNDLMEIINIYLKFHPEIKGELTKNINTPFLVNHKNKRLTASNLKEILNSIFGKNISSSMLRHIYLSHKYGDTYNDMVKDAKMMGHSLIQQAEYVKN